MANGAGGRREVDAQLLDLPRIEQIDGYVDCRIELGLVVVTTFPGLRF